ncbi:hypothetical protein ES288_A12G032700v1 [Gossypium darwinii]|uniref:Uncharacterized protein n=1 Tax=Gossypium darwinii TaxID=34276 RepID=A0A5D2E5L0_GOSDA|nr:hypothetical protein ES288_A12G032700v1 [Gossypium darwinii]
MADGAQMASRSHPQKPRPRRLGTEANWRCDTWCSVWGGA